MAYLGKQNPVALYDSYTKAQTEATFAPITRSRKNLIINGGFDIWQRGTSFTDSAGYTADRWICTFLIAGSVTTNTTRQPFTPGQTEVPGEPAYFLRANYSAVSGGAQPAVLQRVEGVRNLAGKTVTIKFYARVGAATTFGVNLKQEFGSGGTAANEVPTNINGTAIGTSWTKFTTTVTLPNISGATIGDNNYLELNFNFPTDTPVTFDIAQVQLEEGDTATDFEYRPIGEELALCQRYYMTFADIIGYPVFDSGDTGRRQSYQIAMRAAPSVAWQSRKNGTLTVAGLVENASAYGFSLSSDAGINDFIIFTNVRADAEL